MINGVQIIPKIKIADERGTIMTMLRADDQEFEKFGEIYFSTIYPGVVKAWHVHTEMTLNYYCVVGMIKLVLWDNRLDSDTRGQVYEIFIGDDNPCLVKIPSYIWNGFKCISIYPAIVANCATKAHDDKEIFRISANTSYIPYNWDRIDR
jgi:dTDP-4-dehydrorhamnose 3,5-epimerase